MDSYTIFADMHETYLGEVFLSVLTLPTQLATPQMSRFWDSIWFLVELVELVLTLTSSIFFFRKKPGPTKFFRDFSRFLINRSRTFSSIKITSPTWLKRYFLKNPKIKGEIH